VLASVHLNIHFVIRFAPRWIERLALRALNEAMLATSH
jgi:hypothetical protein